VSPSLFDVLGVRPALGRGFTDADTPPGASPVALVSHAFWQLRLGGRADALGASLRLDGEPVAVVGVMGPRVAFPDPAVAVWRPLHVPPTVTPGSSNGNIKMFNAIARLKPGVTPEQAAAEGSARAQAAPQAGPVAIVVFGSDGPAEVRVIRLLDDQTREVRPALLLLLAAVGLLLAASAANVANVQLARALARRRELAIRSALGADARALARQLVIEGAVLGACGGAIGLLMATGLTAALPAWLPADFPRIDEIAMDWRGALAAFAAALAAGAAAGTLPAWYARRTATAQALNEDGHSAIGVGHRSAAGRARSLVMAAQVAIATVLLVGASLLVRSFLALLAADRGFDTASVLTAELPLPRDTTGARRQAILDASVERLEAVPGVVAAGYTSILPLSGSESIRMFEMPGRDGQARRVRTSFRVVSADYMKALGMRVRAGRLFDRGDTAASRRVVVVNAAFTREYLGDSPLGAVIPDGPAGRRASPDGLAVVGVLDDVRAADGTPVGPEMFVPQPQWNDARIGGDPVLAIRTVGAPREIGAIVRSVVAGVDPTLALGRIATMEERVVEQLARPRLYAALLAGFAGLALAIAGVGLFGVLSFSVAQRARELAVRSALGAAPASLLALVVRQGLAVTAVGLVAGVAASAALAGWLGRWLYGIDGREPVTYVAVAAFLLVVATAASAAPALRAARLDPLAVLKRG
jgi:predicted permease